MNKNYFIAGTIVCMIMAIVSMFISGWLFFLFVILMITSIVMTNIAAGKTEKNNIKEDMQKINNLIKDNNLNKDQFFINLEHTNAILLDEENQLLATFIKKNNNFQLTHLPFSSIIESEIVEDEISVIKTSRTSQIGGALVGSVLAGGVGAVIGGLSGERTSKNKVNKIQLNIKVDSLKSPIHYIQFMNTQQPMDKSNHIYIQLYDKAMHWHSLASAIIKKQDNKASNH